MKVISLINKIIDHKMIENEKFFIASFKPNKKYVKTTLRVILSSGQRCNVI